MRKLNRSCRRRARSRGFTMLETMLTLVIVSVGVAAVFDSYGSFTVANEWSSRTATAELLANEIREFTRNLPRHDPVTGLSLDASGAVIGWGLEPGEVQPRDIDDIDDLDGIVFQFAGADLNNLEMPGPIDAAGNVVDQYIITTTDLASGNTVQFGWVQSITVTKVSPFDYADVLVDSYNEPAAPGVTGGIDIDEYPLRITVTVGYQGMFDSSPTTVTTLSWIIPE